MSGGLRNQPKVLCEAFEEALGHKTLAHANNRFGER
jgi:hypothetical protein